MFCIGIDLGTSSVKLLFVDESGTIHKTVSKDYPLYFPKNGWSEQNPEDWWEGVLSGLRELTAEIDFTEVKGIACGGQMHGLVLLDENDQVIRPCILWNDGRTAKETEWLNTVIGKDRLSAYTANIAFAGFTAPKILWVRDNEPENFARIAKIMLPKDYINYKLTGVHCTDYSDASGMLLLDVKNKCWSKEMCEICSVKEKWLPQLFESYDIAGTVSSLEIPFLHGIPVAAGAGDNAAAAIGTNTIKDGACNISLGTSGTVFLSADRFSLDPNNALHAFAHASGRYHLMGCMLSAASCNKWFMEEILHRSDFDAIQKQIPADALGNNAVYFLPYLMGERSPLNDENARACFIGMHMGTTDADMIQAVFEGVAFAIRDSVEVARSLGIDIQRSCLCGGGAKSKLWQKILANVLNLSIDLPVTEEGPGYGAAMLAMTGIGRFPDLQTCADTFCRIRETIQPDPVLAEKYEKKYRIFRQMYPALKEIFRNMKEE